MRIVNLVAGEKWTGTAAVVFDQTAALVGAGVEAQFAFVARTPLAARLENVGWARPIFTHPRTPWNFAADVRRLRAMIPREKIDLLHAHTTHDHYVATFALALAGSGAALFRTFHHVRHVRSDPWSRALFARTTGFAFANRAIADAFGGSGPVQSPVVDTDRFHPGPADERVVGGLGIQRNGRRVGTVGKLAAGRGHEEAIRAAAPLASAPTLVHVGHGEELPALRKLAEELGAGSRNVWTGYQEDALPDLYRAFDAFLFTASGSDQGQRAILEAMASGVPVVALDLPGVRDLVTDGEHGFVVARPEDLGPALERLFASEETRRRISRNARRRALDFTPERFAETAKAFYEERLEPKS